MPDLSTGSDPAEVSRRFGGMDRLYGVEGAGRIRRAHVVVVGIGGVGSWAAEALARSGVGRLTLVDMDHVSESNVNRQIHALTSTIGQAKVLAMKERIAQINPHCQVRTVDDFVTPENWPGLLSPPGKSSNTPNGTRTDIDVGFDAVIDACDQVSAKTAMAAWAMQSGALFVSAGAAGGKRLAHLVDIDDLSATTHDPLLAQVRNRLRKFHGAAREGKRMNVYCVFSREAVRPPDASCVSVGDGTLNCHGYGSVVSVTATFGQCAAGWILEKLASTQTASQ